MPNDTEIEVKIPIEEDVFYSLRELIKSNSVFLKKINQSDEYFTPAHRNFVGIKYPYEWLRIGRRGDKIQLNYKHFYPENVEIFTHCDEYETEIQNENQLLKILTAMNFKKLVTVEKERETYLYNNIFEIAFDTVKDLGYFIEIEAKKDLGSIEETKNRILEFAKTLGLDISKADQRGYPYLAMEKMGFIQKD